MNNIPFDRKLVDGIIAKNKIKSVGAASIREVKKIIDDVEKQTGTPFIRMEMGIPGLPPTQVGVQAQIDALASGIASIYPDIYGTASLKHETARFAKNFMNLDIPEDSCVPSVGSMQGGFASFLTISRMDEKKRKILFIDPGFPVTKLQCRILGIETERFDVYNYRGEKLRAKLESYLQSGEFAALIYSSPNNPAWFCFNDQELQIIGQVANKHDIVVIEDLAYFGMDFRHDYSKPGVAPYQPTVGHYANKYIILISGSKAFSYAGERIAVMIISPELYNHESAMLQQYFGQKTFGRAVIFGSLYALSSGTSHSAQYALAAIMKACNDGKLDFIAELHEYQRKAHIMKKALTDNGFVIVYDKDLEQNIGDGFYFTFAYPGMSGVELLDELVYYGISAISLSITGSDRTEGVRACVSLVPNELLPELPKRLEIFNTNMKAPSK